MRMYDIIAKKRDGGQLSAAEIDFAISGYTGGSVPDYQMSALLMAVFFKGMHPAETAALTAAMARSGDVVDLSAISGIKADKHSTGGVGDKTTLVVAPIVAACGVKMAKMSGRGLGHTGGTIDKLQSIPGFRVELTQQEFFSNVEKVGIAVVGQSGNLAPADKKMYALRDVTATVNSIPLIASSIMSKKLAAGADAIVLDVKVGSGAFMKDLPSAIELAQQMVAIGNANGRQTAALITNMGVPLGRAIGNACEVAEAVDTLRGSGSADLTEIALSLAAAILQLAQKGDKQQCRALAQDALRSGAALDKLRQMVQAQGGDASYIDDPLLFGKAVLEHKVVAPQSGYIIDMDTEKVGIASMILGAGRETKEQAIDPLAGIMLLAKTGDEVKQGDTLAVLHTSDEQKAQKAHEVFLQALRLQEVAPEPLPLILAKVDKDGVEQF